MAFENLILDIELLEEKPSFSTSVLRDINPLAKSEKKRLIEKPNDAMKLIHRRLVNYLRRLPVDYLYATGCIPGSSPLKNVGRHQKSRFFYLLDLKSAYRHVSLVKLANVICKADSSLGGQKKDVRNFLKNYCVSKFGGLPMGAPASPDLFNLYCLFLLDKPIEKILVKYRLVYTRYLDDLTFSASLPITRKIRKEIRAVIKRAGFSINHLKSEVSDLKKGPIFINGIGLEFGGRVFVPRNFTDSIQGLIHKGLQGHFDLWPQIEGAMGVFYGITNRKRLNWTERKVVKEYQKFRRLIKN